MKIKELIKHFGDQDLDEIEMDPEQFVREQEWNKKDKSDYRHRTVNRLLNAKQDFSSEANIFRDVAVRIITLKCPQCGREVKGDYSGGTFCGKFSMCVFGGSCDNCKIKISLDMPSEGISIKFKK